MTNIEATQILAILKAAYPNSYRGMSKEEAQGTVTVWAIQFADIPVEMVTIAVNKLIASSPFPPAISEVKRKLGSLYWEAREMLDRDMRARRLDYSGLTDKKREFYQAVVQATKEYKINIEPSIEQIIGSGQILMLGEGE